MRTGVKKRGYVSVLRKRPGRTAMELATTPMAERQRKYRENYRERVAGWYNGWLHYSLGHLGRSATRSPSIFSPQRGP